MKSKLEHKYSLGEEVRFPDGNMIKEGKVQNIIFNKYRENGYHVYYRIAHSAGRPQKINEEHVLPLEQE